MKTKYSVAVIVLLWILLPVLQSEAQFIPSKHQKVRVIFDSDMGPDYDDVGAIALLHTYADSGYVDILATIASTKYGGVASVLNIFNTYFKRPDIPVGVPVTGLILRDPQSWSDSLIAKYPHRITSNNQAYESVALYRKILAAQPDHSVTLITVGFLTNIAHLMRSGPDQYSALDGASLIDKKVKVMISMAGKFPKGKEFNLIRDSSSAYYVLSNWRKPLLFSGFEVGKKIKVGLKLISDNSIRSSPVKDVYRICMLKDKVDSVGRMSWDLTAVLAGIKGYVPYYSLQRGNIIIHKDGSNEWKDDENGKQAYLIESMDYRKVGDILEHAMMHQPMNSVLNSK
ncbi:nucleoside hydrolase [Pedobacter sp. BS3]|uniref:nucleoside hydrolase n=1 Tax=Pedobacter sp. BS3 TaxID=2567937 RepID=UPI0011EBC8D9|nr:nucleoside hydrolase [Pedobacter sp. BS3]TZF81867.1 nucleoside hydrolase [Pedobacter sp. BS3]